MRIGVSLREPSGPDPMTGLREQVRQAADDGFASAWISNIFGLDALTALAVAGNQVEGIDLGTAVVPTYPRHPAVLAQQALTAAAACRGRLILGIGLSHKIVIEDMYGYDSAGRSGTCGSTWPCCCRCLTGARPRSPARRSVPTSP